MAGSHEVRGSIPLCSTKYSQVIEATRWPVCFSEHLGATLAFEHAIKAGILSAASSLSLIEYESGVFRPNSCVLTPLRSCINLYYDEDETCFGDRWKVIDGKGSVVCSNAFWDDAIDCAHEHGLSDQEITREELQRLRKSGSIQ